jgi:hypothetical protein
VCRPPWQRPARIPAANRFLKRHSGARRYNQLMAYLGRVAAAVSAVVLLAAGGAAGASTSVVTAAPAAYARSLDGQFGVSRIDVAARASVVWAGGAVTASTGEVVNVFVSTALPAETPEKWAEFLVNLTHGPEITLLTTRLATLDEVRQLCGRQALGCYFRNEMIALGEPLIDGATTPEEIVRHEYGHHVANHRLNTPWRAIDWGPKNWSSTAGVCARVSRGEAFPGNEGRNYSLNPGEAWAETYRLMDERKNGITTASWTIISQSFFPDEPSLLAAERDVLTPWTESRRIVERRVFGRKTKKVWWIPVQTPLDGELTLSATLPRDGLHEVALVAPNRRTVIRRAQWVGQRVKRTAASVCGHRTLFVRVTQSGGLGRVTVTATAP